MRSNTPKSDFRDRVRIAAAIRAVRAAVAVEVTNEFLIRHPEWPARYGDRARQFGIEDAGYHQDFLAAAIESGEVEAFGKYGAWAAGMLMARHIEPSFLAENLNQIGHALRVRLPAPDGDIATSFISSGIERCLSGAAKTEPAQPLGQFGELTTLYTDAAIRGYRRPALNLLLEAVRQGHPVIDIYSDVLQTAMYRIGRLWEENKITVAQEHMATAITQFVIGHLYPLIDREVGFRGKLVLTGVQGEFHQVGALMVADVLEAAGWDVRFLGTDTPINGVLGAIEEHEAGLFGISATMLFNLSSVSRLVDSVRAKFGHQIRIMLGGGAFRSVPLLYKEFGADGCGLDLPAAVALANDLLSPSDGVQKSVLIADDDPGVRKWLRLVLEEAGYQVTEAENGRVAMRILSTHSMHLVLVDLVMPEQEGLETIPKIRTGFPGTRIIAMSGAFAGMLLSAARALGASDVLQKPISAQILLDKVRQVLGN